MRTIKYTGLANEINVYIDEIKSFIPFKRNQWKDVSDLIAKNLLKLDNWVDKEDFIVNLPKQTTPIRLGLFRFGALGDLIQLVPIARYIKRVYHHEILLITQAQHVGFMKNFSDVFSKVLENSSFHKQSVDKLIILDGVLEQDHSTTNDERNYHRVNLFEKFFNFKCDTYDFSMSFDLETKNKIKRLLNVAV